MLFVKRTVVSKFCCSSMEKAVEDKAIVLPSHEEIATNIPVRIFGPHDARSGGLRKFHSIFYCPFCSEKILFEEGR